MVRVSTSVGSVGATAVPCGSGGAFIARGSATPLERFMSRPSARLLYYTAPFLFLWAALLMIHEAQAANIVPFAAPAPKATEEAAAPSVSPSPSLAPAAAQNSTTGTSVLDPAQVQALQALGLPAGPDACTTSHPTQIQCDDGSPLRHVTLLGLQYCPASATLSEAALANLSTLTSLSFLDCPVQIAPWPPALAQSLTSFTAISSLGRTLDHLELEPLPGWWVGRLHNLEQLTILDVTVNATSADVILSNMTALTELTIQNAGLSGPFPGGWSATNLTTLDLSNNLLSGPLSPSLRSLKQLTQLNVAQNSLSGTIPSSLGELSSLNKLQLNGNRLSGQVPASLANLTSLVYLDLSSNRLNGSVPAQIGDLSALRYLDLSNNSFEGPVPFTGLFLSQLNTFQVSGNPQLCYNSSVLAAKLAGGLPPCDGNGLPSVVPGAFAPTGFAPASSPKAQGSPSAGLSHHKGPGTLVWAAGIGVGVVVLLIVVIVVASRCCSSEKD